MAHIYEVGYGTYEESSFAQIQHRRKFTKSRFEKMVLDCVVEVAKLHYDLHMKSWLVDEHAAYRDAADLEDGEELVPGRKSELASAMKWRLEGKEDMYVYALVKAYFPEEPDLTYQYLHDDVVKMMCDKYGFKPIEKLHGAYFFGWSNLCVKGSWGRDGDDGGIQSRAVRLVRKLVCKGEPSSAERKWNASRKRALRGNPAAGAEQDEQLCLDLGVEYIPYDHPQAVAAREALKAQNLREQRRAIEKVEQARIGRELTEDELNNLVMQTILTEAFKEARGDE